jgi:plastocyanin
VQVTQDKAHCLSKGDILDQTLIVNEKNRGIKNVVVWLRPDDKDPKSKLAANQIHPDDQKRKGADVEIDQPCCMFTPRITLARVGDTIVVKNSAPVPHNFFWTSGNNGNQNPNIPPGGNAKVGPLVAENTPIQYKCSIHPWMSGYVRVFEHPYFAVTDDDGKFTIPNAPVGKFRLVAWHEKVGFLGGREGRFGTPVEIKGGEGEVPALTFTELGKQDK